MLACNMHVGCGGGRGSADRARARVVVSEKHCVSWFQERSTFEIVVLVRKMTTGSEKLPYKVGMLSSEPDYIYSLI